MSVIVVADVVGYSRLTEEDEAGTIANVRALRLDVIEPLIARHGGRLVKLMGDGLLAEFASVVEAVTFSVALQRDTAAHQAGLPVARRLVLRIGVNLGDVVVDGDDLLGDGVNVAARLEQLAEPGGICLSGTVYDHLAGKVGVGFAFSGEQQVKNIARPVRTYRVLLDGGPPDRTAPAKPANAPRRAVLAAAGLVALAALAGGWWLFGGTGGGMGGGVTDARSVAVLPFTVISASPDDTRLADGLVEDLVSTLARNPRLVVMARMSTASIPEGERSPDLVARRLSVRYVVAGSLRPTSAGSTRLTIRLIDGPVNATLWNEQYDLAPADLADNVDATVEKIAAALADRILTGSAAAP
jgi:class 3 adenylate cyclase/TolB-like protein